jgi:catechol 2,3-dioxygenase
MSSASISALRSVEIGLPDVAAAERFYVDTWRLTVAARAGSSVYLRGTGADHHLLALHESATPELRMVTFRAASAAALDTLAQAAQAAGGKLTAARAPVTEPGGGEAVIVQDPQGRILRFVHGDARHADAQEAKNQPIRLAHAVMNSVDVKTAQAFYEQLGFKLSDRTRIMAFMRIPTVPRGDHHSIALADADNNCLNHIAFLMPDLESVMRGGGRMKDAGYAIEWGPGRHGPGDNAFNYFIGPAGFVIEYTAEVEQVDDSYQSGGPEDWKWPAGRVDHWGISAMPSARLKQAQREIGFPAP